ncbi:RNA-binding region-containing protein 3 [Halyomorpha halys]|uniref:RNA-binding region-containing protein 3 n=1 Tax=Halyomorpha halys TaxID=286706 RepID=UPI0006D4EE83|nr:RNA-binding protein 40 [Halyomorpha halys]
MVQYDNCSLVVRHLPSQLTKEDKIDLLKFFGAEEVKCVSSKVKQNSLVFAKFSSQKEAEAALKKLHQTEILDQIISVEYVRGNDLKRIINSETDRQDDTREEQTLQKKYLENFLQKLNSWTDHFDFHQPPPVHFKYQYPPPTLQVLTNIAKALASVPKFYTQVLHLMNKMNLPCPFSENFNIETNIVPEQLPIGNGKRKLSSEEESEIESDEEMKKDKEVLTAKQQVKKLRKVIKKPKLIKPVIQTNKVKSSFKPEDVFETEQIELPKKIEVKVSADLKRLEVNKEEIAAEGFEKVLPVTEKEEVKETEDMPDEDKVISTEELSINRISPQDQHMLPVFKNYQAGIPSCRLYLKNLAKAVTMSDLRYIYKRYLLHIEEEQGSMFHIQLLQEGRMKGQAFISLQNIEQAKLALTETNGYVLRGKPMVVQFARSFKPK